MDKVAIIGAVRTPIGRYMGALRDVPAYDLGALVLNEVVKRARVDPPWVDDVIMGQSYQSGEYVNIARMALLKAGWPVEVPGITIDRRCCSGLDAICFGAMKIQSGFRIDHGAFICRNPSADTFAYFNSMPLQQFSVFPSYMSGKDMSIAMVEIKNTCAEWNQPLHSVGKDGENIVQIQVSRNCAAEFGQLDELRREVSLYERISRLRRTVKVARFKVFSEGQLRGVC